MSSLQHRPPLTVERLVDAAIAIADQGGIAALNMRAVARALSVTPMSLYHHVADKEALIDAMVDRVIGAIRLPDHTRPWRQELAARAHSARAVLGRHAWAVALLDSRSSPGPATLRHHDAVLGTLFAAGFGAAQAGHAVALLDACVYGYVLQEAALPIDDSTDAADLAAGIMGQLSPQTHPHLVRFAAERVMAPGYDFGAEFAVGLDLVLDGLERLIGS